MTESTIRAGGIPVRMLTGAEAVGRAAELASLTRAAYQGSDPFRGLPVPDGARELPGDVLADLGRGAVIWVAEHRGSPPAGVLRVTEAAGGAWEIGRISVHPAHCGRGVARGLVDAVDRAAVARHIPALRLNAVVERCLPSLYLRLGFAPVRHWPAADKPLTEVTMERGPATQYGAPGCDPCLPAASTRDVLLVWEMTSGALAARVTRGPYGPHTGARAPGTRLAGVDLWRDAGTHAEDALREALLSRGGRPDDGAVVFPADRAAVRAHLMPRTAHPRLLAGYRPPPGKEPPVAHPTSSLLPH